MLYIPQIYSSFLLSDPNNMKCLQIILTFCLRITHEHFHTKFKQFTVTIIFEQSMQVIFYYDLYLLFQQFSQSLKNILMVFARNF